MTDNSKQDDARTLAIRKLNDAFRQTFKGGRIVATAGVMALDEAARLRLFLAVQDFDEFDGDNDPWGEHDFGALEAEGERVFFKIDYFAPGGDHLSEDPADLQKTSRVMTIMLASEY